MKKQISTFLLAVLLCGSSCVGQVEQESYTPATPKWVSEKGYWTIESNIKTPMNSIVYFYTNENVLVYKEKIEGVRIDLRKRRVLMHLKAVLEQAVGAWQTEHIFKHDEMLVSIALKK